MRKSTHAPILCYILDGMATSPSKWNGRLASFLHWQGIVLIRSTQFANGMYDLYFAQKHATQDCQWMGRYASYLAYKHAMQYSQPPKHQRAWWEGMVYTLPTGMQLNTSNLLNRKMDQPLFIIVGKVNSPLVTTGKGEPSIPHSGGRWANHASQ